MKFFLFVLFNITYLCISCNTTKKIGSREYQFGVSFSSKCCGTPSDDFLKEFLKHFKSENKINLSADIAEGCGREGEFLILINLQKTSIVKKKELGEQLQELAKNQNEKNQNDNSSAGIVSLITDPGKPQYEYCRLPLKNWIID